MRTFSLLVVTLALLVGVAVPARADEFKPAYLQVTQLDQDTYDVYDPKVFDGAPVSLQLIGRSMMEEQLLAVAMAMDAAVKA